MKNLLLLIISAIVSLSPLNKVRAKAFYAITNNTISADQTICTSSTPAAFTGSVPAGGTGTFLYQWQRSTTSATAGFANITGATGQNYSAGALTATTWYRRTVFSGIENDISSVVQVTVSPTIPAASNTISAAQAICYNSSPLSFTGSTPTGGNGSTYNYQWQSSPDNVSFTDITAANSIGYSAGALTANTWFRRVVLSGGCSNTSASIKITITPTIANNSSTADQSICSGQTALALTGSTPTGGSGAYSYLWQSSTTSATTGFATAAGITNGKNYTPASQTQTTWYRRVVTSGACTDISPVTVVTVISTIPGTPSVYGDDTWNVYAYSDATFTTYAGFYTEPLLSFATTNRYTTTQSPSSAAGWQGCLVAPTNFSVSMKRTDFTPANYQLDLSFVDDAMALLVNGVQVYSRACCVAATTNNIWTGALGATDQVEIRWTQTTGGSRVGVNFTPVTPAALVPGSITKDLAVCYGEAPSAGFTSTAPATSGCTFIGYQWQSSIDSVTWTDIAGATAATYTETAALTQTTWYRRVAKDYCNNSLPTSPVKITVNVTPPGDPTVYGDNVWNVYEYQGAGTLAAATYKGFYTEPLLTFDSRNRWASGTSPSTASGYQGCYVAPTSHWMVYKRTDFASGIYQLDIPAHDDNAYLIINGIQVFVHVGCCDAHTNVWTGPLGPSDVIEYRVWQGGGGAYQTLSFTTVTPAPLVGGTITPSQSICAGNIPPTPLTETAPASGGCTFKSFQWQFSTDNGSTWSDVSGATAISYTITNSITVQTQYRRNAFDVCGNMASSNAITISLDAVAPGDPTVYGNGTWNVYCYQDVTFSQYAGYYTEPSLTFQSTNRYASSLPPSAASGYQGCQLVNNYYSVSMKRTNFPAGLYQIDVTQDDDYNSIYINGTLVSSLTYPTLANNVWTGNLGPTDQIEIRWRNNAGPGTCGVRFTIVTTGTLSPGSITATNPGLCANDLPVISNLTAASGGCFVNYTWESSVDGGTTWTTVAGATGASYTATTSPTTDIMYRRVAADNCGAVARTAPVTFTQTAGTIGDPTVYGNGAWNVYAYQSGNSTNFAIAQYRGYYTEPLLSFSSANRWGSTNSPSDASGYQGCQVSQDFHWVSYRRTNITGTYQIDVSSHDDNGFLFINGVQVWSHLGCCDTHTNVWTGTLSATDKVEFRWEEFNGGSNGGLNFTAVTPSTTLTPGAITADQTICSGTTPVAFSSTNDGSSTCYLSYQWQSSPDNVTYTDISGATATTYAPAALTTKTYFRRKALNACGTLGYSNVVTVTIYSMTLTGGTVTANQVLCSGGTPAQFNSSVPPTGGDGIYVYQWQISADNIGFSNISGATSATYLAPMPSATAWYRRSVTACGSASSGVSNSVSITVNQSPVISSQPGNAAACSGGSTTISVTASGTIASYQWQVNTGSGWSNLSNASPYSGVNLSTLTISPANPLMNGYLYRVVITGSCGTITSNTSTLTVGTISIINTQPASKTVCVGSNVNFAVSASGSGLTYQWQVKIGAAPYVNLADNAVYSGSATATLTITGVTAAMNNYSYQVIVGNSCGVSLTSSAATLTTVAAIVNTIAADQNICAGFTANNLTGTSSGAYAYLWQTSTTSASTGFVNGSNANTNSGYVPNPVSATTYYRRVVTNAGCTSTSTVVTIAYNASTIAITTQPTAKAVCAGGTTSFSAAGSGPGTLTYQWVEFTGSVTNVLTNGGIYSGATTATLTLTGVTAAMNNYRYYLRVYAGGCSTNYAQSTGALLTTNSAPAITSATGDVTTCNNTGINLSVNATGVGLAYQWQLNTGSGWNNLSNFGIYSNVNGSPLSITPISYSMNGYQYRCIVTGTCAPGTATSTPMTLTVNPPIGSNSIYTGQTICGGTPTPLTGSTPTGGNGTFGYQWYYDNGSGYIAISGATGQDYSPGAIFTTTNYLRQISSGNCPANNSTALQVKVTPATSTSDPANTAVCAGTNATFAVTAVGTNPAYQWQVNTGSLWSNISNGVLYSGVNTATLTVIAPLNGMNAYQYRAIVTSNCSPLSVTSAAAVLTINPTATITAQPQNVNSCQGSTAIFAVTATGSGLIYQWQEKVGSGAFADITDGGVYGGSTTPTLTLTGITTAMNTNQYRVLITAGTCPVNSATASLTVNALPALVITNPAAVCAPGTVSVSAAAVTAGSNLAGGTLSYWTNAANTISLTTPSAVAASGTYYIRVATSVACYDNKPVTVTINPVIAGNTIAAAQTICTGSTPAALTGGAVSGGSGVYAYQWQSSTDNISFADISGATGTGYAPGSLTATTWFRRVVGSGACSNISGSAKITVVPYPTAAISYPGTPYCATGTAAVTRTGQTGGTYSSTTGLTIDATTGTVDLVTSTAGTYIVTYSFSNGTCGSSTTSTIKIVALPTLVINNPAPVCAGTTVDLTVASVTAGSSTGLTFTYFTDAAATTSLGSPNAVATSGTYYIKATNSTGCSTVKPVTVTINANPVLVINNPAAVCSPNTVDLTASAVTAGSSSGLTFTYFTNAAATASLSNPNAVAASGTYYIKATNASGCTAVKPVTVTINPLPVATIAYPANPYCATGTAPVTRTGVAGGSYSSTAGLTIDPATGAVDLVASTVGTYTVTYTFSNGTCSNTTTGSITINALPSLVITNPAAVCSPNTVDITVAAVTAASDAGLTLGYFSNAAATTILGSPNAVAASGTYYIKATNSNGCVSIKPVTVVINPLPSASVSYPGTPYCATGTATVNQTGQAGGTYSSTTGLSIDASTGTVDLVASAAGTYTVTYTFTNGTCGNATTTSIRINALPSLIITDPAPVCSGATTDLTAVAVTAGSGSGLTFAYFTDAAGTVVLSNPNAVATSGIYYIKATNSNGCTTIKPVNVTVNANPVLVISNPGAVCFPNKADLTAAAVTAGSSTGLTYTYFSNSAANVALSNPNAVAVSGTYYIKAVNSSGCSTVKPVVVTINPLPVASIAYTGTPYCQQGTAYISVTGQAGGTFSSTTGITINPSTGDINLGASAEGSYTVTYTFSNGSCSNTTVTSVVIKDPVLKLTDPSPVCAPSTINLTNPAVTAGSEAGLNFNYYLDASGMVPVTTPAAVSTAGPYYIRGTKTSTGCLSHMLAVNVVFYTKPSVSALASATDICTGSSVVLTASSPGNDILWSGVGAGPSVTVKPVNSTKFMAIATTADGCKDSTTVDVTVKPFHLALAANPDPVLAGTTTTLTSSANFDYNVLSWSPAVFFTDQTSKDQTIIVKDTSKTFQIVGISDQGCLDTATLLVNVDPNLKDFFIPNAFTPNGDGNNDVFKVYGSSIQNVTLRIYNQWGETIRELHGLNDGWDGTWKGKPQVAGPYFWEARVTFYNNVIIKRKGTITLIR